MLVFLMMRFVFFSGIVLSFLFLIYQRQSSNNTIMTTPTRIAAVTGGNKVEYLHRRLRSSGGNVLADDNWLLSN